MAAPTLVSRISDRALSGYSAPYQTPSSEPPRYCSGSDPRPTVDPHCSALTFCVVTRPTVVRPHCPIRAIAPHAPLVWNTVPDTRSYCPSRGLKGKAVPNAACLAAQSPISAVTAVVGWSATHSGVYPCCCTTGNYVRIPWC